MKKVLYSACILPMLIYAGGDILPVDTQYDEIPNVPVEVIPPKKEEIVIPPKKEEIVVPPKKEEIVTPPKVERVEVQQKPASKFYGGVSAAYMNNSGETSSVIVKDANPYALIAKVGYNIIENLAIEGQVGTGVKDETNIPTASVDSEFQNLWAIYLKPNITIMDKLNLHALAGYARTKQSINSTDLHATDFSYGAGLGYALTDNIEIVMDAMRYSDKSDSKVDGYTVGLDFKF